MDKLPRKQQEYYDLIKQSAELNDDDMLADLVRNKNPLAIRHDLSSTLGQHVRENYDSPLHVFKDSKLVEEIPIIYTNELPEDIAGRYVKENGVLINKKNISNPNRITGTTLHELDHAIDISKGFETQTPTFSKTKQIMNTTGLEAAEKAIGQHHNRGFFEKQALFDLLKNKKLSALAPLLKSAGLAGTIYGLSQGDVFAADPTGLLQTEELGKGSDIVPKEETKDDKKKEDNKFKKVRQAMGIRG